MNAISKEEVVQLTLPQNLEMSLREDLVVSTNEL